MARDKIKRKRPVKVQQQQQQQPVAPTRRSTRGTFTAQDSFASSDEDVDLNTKVKQLHQRRALKTTQRHPAPRTTPTKSKDKNHEDENNEQQEESEDEEYKADSSDNEEEELEPMDQTNLTDEVRWLVEGNEMIMTLVVMDTDANVHAQIISSMKHAFWVNHEVNGTSSLGISFRCISVWCVWHY